MTEAAAPGKLKREVGVFGATMIGVGSMVGTGVFVSIGIAAGVAGPAVLLAIALAAIVATCNALSSAQLAASMPVSGGTYEYGYAYLTPWLGFTAGWMFLGAKTASAATAALGWAVFTVKEGRARTTLVKVDHRNDRMAEVVSGLSEGERVILHPSDRITEGVAVEERRSHHPYANNILS